MQNPNTNPLLSIIVPVYNVEDYLTECLDSLIAIKTICTEIIIVNDGSTDSSADIIECYKQYDHVKVITKKNGGQSAARNDGIAVSTGQYVAFVDSDDMVFPEKVSLLVEKARALGLDIICGRAEKIDKNYKKVLMPVPQATLNADILCGKKYLKLFYDNSSIRERNYRPEAWLMIYRRDFLMSLDNLFMEGIIYEDELFTLKIVLLARFVLSEDIVFYQYRWRDGSTTNSISERHVRSKAIVAKASLDVLKQTGFRHPFILNRIIGWCRESIQFWTFQEVVRIFGFRGVRLKDCALLVLLCIKTLVKK